jgi:hypothetical protein
VRLRNRAHWPPRAPKRRRGSELHDCRTKSQNSLTALQRSRNRAAVLSALVERDFGRTDAAALQEQRVREVLRVESRRHHGGARWQVVVNNVDDELRDRRNDRPPPDAPVTTSTAPVESSTMVGVMLDSMRLLALGRSLDSSDVR